MKIVVCGLPFSANLGDAVISQCLRTEISKVLPAAEVEPIDIGGRTQFGEPRAARRRAILRQLLRLPRSARRVVLAGALVCLVLPRWILRWRANTRHANLVIVGGGQLFADVDLNFPLKLFALVFFVVPRQVRIAVYSVGVLDGWSILGRWLFRRVLLTRRIMSVSVRDRESRLVLERHCPELAGRVSIALDPGLLASRTFGRSVTDLHAAPVMGIGVCSGAFLGYSANLPDTTDVQILVAYAELVSILAEAGGHRIALFTNGAPEDAQLCKRLFEIVGDGDSASRIMRLPTPTVPSDLAFQIANMSVVLSHRLHANIVAYSYGVPSVAVSWDPKVQQFFDLTKRSTFVIAGPNFDPKLAATAMKRALAGGLDEKHRVSVMDEASGCVRSLLSASDPTRSAT